MSLRHWSGDLTYLCSCSYCLHFAKIRPDSSCTETPKTAPLYALHSSGIYFFSLNRYALKQ